MPTSYSLPNRIIVTEAVLVFNPTERVDSLSVDINDTTLNILVNIFTPDLTEYEVSLASLIDAQVLHYSPNRRAEKLEDIADTLIYLARGYQRKAISIREGRLYRDTPVQPEPSPVLQSGPLRGNSFPGTSIGLTGTGIGQAIPEGRLEVGSEPRAFFSGGGIVVARDGGDLTWNPASETSDIPF